MMSVDEIKEALKHGEIKVILIQRQSTFLAVLTRSLIQINFVFEFINTSEHIYSFTIKSINLNLNSGKVVDNCFPMLFVPFSNDSILSSKRFINEKHKLTKWILSNQEALINNYEGYFNSLIRFILDGNVARINEVLQHFRRVFKVSNLSDISYTDYSRWEANSLMNY
jgi:metal-responsive CopG/Arc/MetJ family transcriptional regulator